MKRNEKFHIKCATFVSDVCRGDSCSIIVGTSLKFSAEEIAYLVTVDIFMCGVATFLQANKVTGTGLPIVLGCTFTAVAPMILIGQTKGLDVLYGSLLISGILVVLIAPFSLI